jgi:crotonobetainyl-CoA:carnitine CoA-transferase CaiB-like acyl-CoA transferase
MEKNEAPLNGLSIVDLGTGLSAAVAVRMFADAGAAVKRFEPAAGDPFYDVYPAYQVWHRGKTIAKAADPASALSAADAALETADLCIIGGEDHPTLDWRFDAEAISAKHPKLVVLQITGSPDGETPAVELLAQARSGLNFEYYPDRPMVFALPLASFGAALQGSIGAVAALVEREHSGRGQVVSTSLVEGVLSWLCHLYFQSERSDRSMDFAVPKGVNALIFKCADGLSLHFSFGTGTARRDVYGILGIDDPTLEQDPRGLPSMARGVRDFYGEIDLLQGYISKWKRDELLHRLWAVGVPAEAVNMPGGNFDDAQVQHNKIIQTESDGVRRIGLPFRYRSAGADTKPKSNAAGSGPLAGLRVVDFGSFTAGPHASIALADCGADVIKIEPTVGDPARVFFRPFTSSSRGKRMLAVDMKKPEGIEIILRLCATAGMVHHNFRPGVAERLGIGYEDLRRRNPDIIMLENSGYGSDGPNAQRAGFDMIFQAFCGHEARAGGAGNEPICYRMTNIDFGAGLMGSFASLIAQYRLAKGKGGGVISTSLLNTAMFFMSELFQTKDGEFSTLPQLNSEQTGFHPTERLYKTSDGWIAVSARADEPARMLAETLGLSDRLRGPVRDWGQAEADVLAAAFATKSTAFAETLMKAGVWAEVCDENARTRLLNDETFVRRGGAVVSHDARYGEVRQLGALFALSRTPTRPDGTSRLLGANTRELLAELGYADSEIDALYAGGVVK